MSDQDPPGRAAEPTAVRVEDGRTEDASRDDDRALDPQRVALAAEAAAEGDKPGLKAVLDALHPADAADLFEQLDHEKREAAARLMGADLSPEVLAELEDDVRDDVVEAVEPEVLAAAARELDPEDVAYLVEDLDEAAQVAVLEALEPVDAAAVRQQLGYPEYSAGRLMRRDFVTAPPFWTVGDMIDRMRASEELPDEFHDVVLVDPTMKPSGLVPLSRIMGSQRAALLEGLKRDRMEVLDAEEPQADVAYAFNQYHMASAPVVDAAGRLVGVIHMEDAMEALDEEAEEDLKRLSGVGDESLSDRVMEIFKRRFPWLAINLATAVLASLVIGQFDEVLEQLVALAVLMPIVASMGGNGATQTLAVVVRALATRDLTRANVLRLVAREAAVGLVEGAAFAALVAAVTVVWYGNIGLAAVIAAAMVLNMLAAGLAGTLVPIALDRAGADPALASGTFVTTVTDVVGFFSFLGLAAVVLL
ncbi:MAG: magnesium transporter [Pseudomonadota bacterium]